MTWEARRLPDIVMPGLTGVSAGPDGALVLARGEDGLALFDEGTRLWQRPEPESGTRGVPGLAAEWAPGGDRCYIVVGGRVRVLDADGEEEPSAALDRLSAAHTLALSPDGRRLAVGTGRSAVIADLARDQVTPLRGVVDAVAGLAWTGTGTLAVATSDTVQLWATVPSAALVRTIPIGDPLSALVADPRGALLAVGGASGVHLIHLREQDRIDRLAVPAAELAFTRTGSHLLTGGPDAVVVCTPGGEQVATLPGRIHVRGQLSVSRGGLIVVCHDERRVARYEPPDAEPRPRRRERPFPRRWAVSMGRTLGRALATRPLLDVPSVSATLVAEQVEGSPAPGFAWSPAGQERFHEVGAGQVARLDPPDAVVWRHPAAFPALDIAVSGDGGTVAVASHNETGRVLLLDAVTGEPAGEVEGGQSPAFSPAGGAHLVVPEPGPDPRAIRVYLNGTLQLSRPVEGGIGRIAWSPVGDMLAAAAGGAVVIWSTVTWNRMPGPSLPNRAMSRVAWSPDGEYLAVTPVAGGGPAMVFETGSWRLRQRCGTPGGFAWAPALSWSPDSRLLLFPGQDGKVVEVWDVDEGVLLRRLTAPERPAPVWAVAWSPDGQTIAVTYTDGRIVRFALEDGPVPPGDEDDRLPYPVETLARLGAVCAEAGGGVPLSLLAGLLAAIGDEVPPELEPVGGLAPVRVLRDLRWPPAARVGVVALLAAEMTGENRYTAPEGYGREELVAALRRVLTAAPVRSPVPAVPVRELLSVLARVDDRTVSLLSVLGPEAVEADPLLPTRLRNLRRDMSPLAPRQRQLLGLRLLMTEDGPAEGRGVGDVRAGLSRRGAPDRLLPTQLALPEEAYRLRRVRDELLYRTRRGRLPPGPRTTILLLDDTPPAYGQVGVTLRTCVHLLATTMIERSRPCVLVRLGAPQEPVMLARRPDLVEVWTGHSLVPPDIEGTATIVRALVPELDDEIAGPPRIILLTHPYLPAPPIRGLRTIRVHYPGRPVPVTDGRGLAPDPQPGEMRGVLLSMFSED